MLRGISQRFSAPVAVKEEAEQKPSSADRIVEEGPTTASSDMEDDAPPSSRPPPPTRGGAGLLRQMSNRFMQKVVANDEGMPHSSSSASIHSAVSSMADEEGFEEDDPYSIANLSKQIQIHQQLLRECKVQAKHATKQRQGQLAVLHSDHAKKSRDLWMQTNKYTTFSPSLAVYKESVVQSFSKQEKEDEEQQPPPLKGQHVTLMAKVCRAEHLAGVMDHQNKIVTQFMQSMIDYLGSTVPPEIRQEEEMTREIFDTQVNKLIQQEDVMVEQYQTYLGLQEEILEKVRSQMPEDVLKQLEEAQDDMSASFQHEEEPSESQAEQQDPSSSTTAKDDVHVDESIKRQPPRPTSSSLSLGRDWLASKFKKQKEEPVAPPPPPAPSEPELSLEDIRKMDEAMFGGIVEEEEEGGADETVLGNASTDSKPEQEETTEQVKSKKLNIPSAPANLDSPRASESSSMVSKEQGPPTSSSKPVAKQEEETPQPVASSKPSSTSRDDKAVSSTRSRPTVSRLSEERRAQLRARAGGELTSPTRRSRGMRPSSTTTTSSLTEERRAQLRAKALQAVANTKGEAASTTKEEAANKKTNSRNQGRPASKSRLSEERRAQLRAGATSAGNRSSRRPVGTTSGGLSEERRAQLRQARLEKDKQATPSLDVISTRS